MPHPIVQSSHSAAASVAHDTVPLRLTVARGQLGLELYRPLTFAPLQLAALSIALPNLRYPLDLSGGVQQFRHRRGVLQQLRLQTSCETVGGFLGQRWPEPLGQLEHVPQVWLGNAGIGVGLCGERGALAFDLLWAPDRADARIVVDNARATAGLGVPLALAIQWMQSVLGAHAQRSGRVFTVADLAAVVSRLTLPAVGVRVPQVRQATLSALRHEGDTLSVVADPSLPSLLLSEHTLLRLELSTLARAGDDALATGDLDAARAAYLLALERAPQQPEICCLLAEIDVAVGGREEAALGLLTQTVPLLAAGTVAGELLAVRGDLPQAREVFSRTIAREPYAPLAASWALRLARLEPGAHEQSESLDRAVALAPAVRAVREARLAVRAARGDMQGVWADAEHLEAAAHGARARHDCLYRAGQALLEGGWVKEAGRMFERALRYAPDDPAASAGLARALLASGQLRRALALLQRAVALAERSDQIDPALLLALAKVLADEVGDLPQAVARVRQVPSGGAGTHEARALEAEWLVRLGDLAGASLAYARLRQAAELSVPANPESVARGLVQASRFEANGDLHAAERHLAAALRLMPRDPQIQVEYREVATRLAAERRALRRGETEV